MKAGRNKERGEEEMERDMEKNEEYLGFEGRWQSHG